MLTNAENIKLKAEKTVTALKRRGLTVATAESCTGGLISSLITSVSSASEIFGLGICSYSPDAKQNILKVSANTLSQYGTVSELTAKEMAENVKALGKADIGISVTGVAGPNTSENKPVGLVFIALSGKTTTVKQLNIENHGRDFIRNTAVCEIFDLIINYLEENYAL